LTNRQTDLLHFKDLPKSNDEWFFDLILERLKEKFPNYLLTHRTITKSQLYECMGRYRFSRHIIRRLCSELERLYPDQIQFHSKGLRFVKNNGEEKK